MYMIVMFVIIVFLVVLVVCLSIIIFRGYRNNDARFSKEFENIINAAISDGELTEKERDVLHKRAQIEGFDPDEFDVIIDERLEKRKTFLGRYPEAKFWLYVLLCAIIFCIVVVAPVALIEWITHMR